MQQPQRLPTTAENGGSQTQRLIGRQVLPTLLHTMPRKAGVTVSVLLATQFMAWLGASIENPAGIFWVGPVAGLFCLVALVMALFYPSPKQ